MKDDREEILTLGILNEIAQQERVTQRHLSVRLGVALGLTNSYLKRCVRKGLVKVTEAPANRYLYYLTPQGFAEKTRLTVVYLSSSLAFYRDAAASMDAIGKECRANGARRVAFGGVSELAEIGALRLRDHGLTVAGTYDPDSRVTRFLGAPVWRSVDDVRAHTAVFTAVRAAYELHDDLVGRFGPDRVLVPAMVRALAMQPESRLPE